MLLELFTILLGQGGGAGGGAGIQVARHLDTHKRAHTAVLEAPSSWRATALPGRERLRARLCFHSTEAQRTESPVLGT